MPPATSSSATWNRLGWRGPLGLAVLLAGGALLLFQAGRMDLWLQAAGWAALVVCAAALLRRTAERILGPVLLFDMVRTVRRSRHALLRSLYASILLAVLFVVYTRWFGRDLVRGLAGIMDEQTLAPSDMARFATGFFHTFLIVQFLAVLLLAPAFTAGAIAEEKEKGTLPDLLTTDLFNREIIFGKLVSRVAHLILLLLTGVPVLSLLQLLGGVDPALLIAGFSITLLTAIGVGALGILCSVIASRPRDAVFLTYVCVFGYQLFTGVFCGAFALGHDLTSIPDNVIGTVSAGNLLGTYLRLTRLSAGGTLDTSLPLLLLQYLAFHGLLSVVCLGWAMSLLRGHKFGGRQGAPAVLTHRRDTLHGRRPRPHPKLGNRPPMLWKELYFERGLDMPSFGRQILTMTAIITLSIAGMVFTCGVLSPLWGGSTSDFSGMFLRGCVPAVGLVGLLGLALRGAGTLTAERERQTLGSLLTTDLTNQEILTAKFRGCFWGMRVVGIVLAVMLALGMLTGGVFPPYVVLLALAGAAHAAFAVNLGMYCSLVGRTTLRATVATVSVFLGVTAGHWLVLLVLTTLCHFFGLQGAASALATFHLYGLTPPMTQAVLLVSIHDLSGYRGVGVGWGPMTAALIGILFYAYLAFILWVMLRARFGAITGRMR